MTSPVSAGRPMLCREKQIAALVVGLLWAVIFHQFFFLQELPNNAPRTRAELLENLGTLFLVVIADADDSSPGNLSQRLPVWLWAGFVVTSAACLGDLILRRLRTVADGPLRWGLAAGLGLSVVSLAVLGLGLAGALNRWLSLVLLVVPIGFWWREGRTSHADTSSPLLSPPDPRWLTVVALAVVTPFVWTTLLGASLPSTDFDVKEYHLQGPKEWWLAGRITFLEHNVYTAFPFLTEMLTLLGMTLDGGWWRGALVGKVILFAFIPLTGAVLWGLGRLVGPGVGPLAAVVWLTAPWAYRSGIIAYTEGGLAYYCAATLAAGAVAWQCGGRWWLLAGLFAGSAASCKYPGVVQAAIPLGLLALAASYRGWRAGGATAFGSENATGAASGSLDASHEKSDQAGVPGSPWWIPVAFAVLGGTLTFAPWLLKNVFQTGNPFYPLLYSVFGGVDLNAEWADQWGRAHSPAFRAWEDPVKAIKQYHGLRDVFVYNDWQTPLIGMFAPLAGWLAVRRLRGPAKRPGALTLRLALGYAVWLYLVWWGLTHHIDRFWVPLLPAASVVSAAGLAWAWQLTTARWVRWAWSVPIGLLLAAVTAYHLVFIATPLCGYNAYFLDYDVARAGVSTKSVAILNGLEPAGRVLTVGEAQVFDAEWTPVYNTVFDASKFRELTGSDPTAAPTDDPLAPADTICRRLREAGISHVLCNWGEVLRYRLTYGYTDYAAPRRLEELVKLGVLEPVNAGLAAEWPADARAAAEITEWAPELRQGDAWQTVVVYRVACP